MLDLIHAHMAEGFEEPTEGPFKGRIAFPANRTKELAELTVCHQRPLAIPVRIPSPVDERPADCTFKRSQSEHDSPYRFVNTFPEGLSPEGASRLARLTGRVKGSWPTTPGG